MILHATYLLLIDGIGTAIATTEEITTEYVQTLGFDAVVPGLECPTALPLSMEPRIGMLDGQSVTFSVSDVTGTLPDIFGVDEDSAEPLLITVAAGTTAVSDSSLYGKHIGVEKIGSAGERRRHSCVPGWHVGLEHISAEQAGATNGAASPVSDKPVVWAGRRACLYRLVRTPGGDWPDLTVEAERLAARVWFGTLTGQGEQVGHEWKLRAAGEESWLMKSIGSGFSQMPLHVEVGATLNEDANEHVLIGSLDILHFFDETDPDDDTNAHVYVVEKINTALLSGAASYEDIATAMDGFLDLLQDDGSLVTALSAEDGNSRLRYSTSAGDDGIQMIWDRAAFGAIGDSYCLRLRVLASQKTWRVLGYDPPVQNSSIDPVEGSDKFCLFERPNGASTADALLLQWAVDYPDHWLGTFWAASPVAMKAKLEGATSVSPEHTNAYGAERRWPPIYPQGTNTFDLGAAAQFFRVAKFEPLFLSSSKAVPLPSDPDDTSSALTIPDVGEVTHQGIVAFTGPYRDETDPEAEVTTITLPARVAWRQFSDGSVATDSFGYPKLAIYDWPDPMLYGFEDQQPSLWSSWRVPPSDGTPLTMRSLLVIEHGTGPDLVGYILARMLATTGAAGGWSGYGLGGGSTQTVGPNDLSIGEVAPYTDAEASAFGLGIPAEMIAIAADEQGGLEAAIEQHGELDVFRCKVVLGKVASAREVMQSLLAPGGWSICLVGGKFGLFDPFTFQAPISDSGVITVESLAGVPGDPRSTIPEQRLRVWSPMDRIELDARLNPVTGDFAQREVFRSPDPQQIYRHQSLKHDVDGSHLIHPLLPNAIGSNWIPSFHDRWRKACRWWSRQHFETTLRVPLRRHAEFGPGSIVTVSNEWLVNPTGQVYGIVQAPGYVIGRTANCKDEVLDVRCIVDASSLIFYSTAARATRYVENEGGVGYRLICADDYLGIRGNTGTFDVDGFVEPDHSDEGGELDIEVFASFDGVVWTGGIYGVVDSVNAATGNCYIQLTGALTGAEWLRDQHHIVVPRHADDQGAAWAFTNLAAIGDKLGNYTGSTKSPKFKD